jgi:N-acyl-D-amino-acid deacylase
VSRTADPSRRLLVGLVFVTTAIAAGGFASLAGQPGTPAHGSRVDVLIQGGNVVDGSGAAPFRADVGILGDRIVFIGDAKQSALRAARTIEAAGMIVAPGFIDPHTHTIGDLSHPRRKSNQNYLRQGVTTVITGNDGRHTSGKQKLTIAQRLDTWQRQGIGTNAALLAGHASIREQVMLLRQATPSPGQLARMKTLLEQAMDQGAFGMSTGLFYYGAHIATEEVIALASVVAARGGILDSHIRDESSYTVGLISAIQEELRIGREARIRVNISHIKALGPEVWGKSTEVIDIIEKARAEGVQVTADQYPYTASGTDLYSALAPRGGGKKQTLRRAGDPARRAGLLAEMEANLQRRGGADALLITSAHDRRLVGKTLAAIARSRGKSPVEAAIDIIAAGSNQVASFNMDERDIEHFMRQDFVMTGSDGSANHPRKYGTFPRKLRRYVYDKPVITLPFAIRSSSVLAAETFGIAERGTLRIGYFADVIVFDEKTVADRATYERPELPAAGVQYVIVNGQVAIDDGKYTGALAGRALRKNQSP